MVTVNPPRGELDSSSVTLREGGTVILQYSDAIYPVLTVKIIPEPAPSLRGTREARKGAGELCRYFWEADVIYLGEVFRLTDRQPVPVYCRICTVHPSPMCRHKPSGQFNAKFWSWDLSL